jgi:hypothetical protein
MRNLCIAVTAAGLMFAQSAWAEPLSPGKPAGVHKAQMDNETVMIVIGVAVVAAAIAVAASSGGGNGPSTMTTAPVVAPTTTG